MHEPPWHIVNYVVDAVASLGVTLRVRRCTLLHSVILAGATFAVCAGTAAEAGVLVMQTIEATASGSAPDVKSSSYRSVHTWRIDPPRFNLTVRSGKDETRYIYNSRTLYVCGQLDEAQLKVLAKATAGQTSSFDRYRKGVCQVVPSNFLVRFFLSPMLAVESVEAADGLNLTLSLRDYTLKAGKASTSGGRPCSGYSRHFVMDKASSLPGGKSRTSDLDETSCMSEDIAWRPGLWPEVAKVVMRQPGGRNLLQQLKQDDAGIPGLQLQGSVRHVRVSGNGKKSTAALTLTTTKVSEEEFAKSLFLPPVGYQLFSPETLDLAAIQGSGDKASATAEASGKKGDELIDMVRSAFFCALAGPLGCIGE